MDVKSKAKNCELELLHDSLVHDRSVCAVIDKVRWRLLGEADLTQGKAWDICRAREITTSQGKALTDDKEINRIQPVRQKNKVKAYKEPNE